MRGRLASLSSIYYPSAEGSNKVSRLTSVLRRACGTCRACGSEAIGRTLSKYNYSGLQCIELGAKSTASATSLLPQPLKPGRKKKWSHCIPKEFVSKSEGAPAKGLVSTHGSLSRQTHSLARFLSCGYRAPAFSCGKKKILNDAVAAHINEASHQVLCFAQERSIKCK